MTVPCGRYRRLGLYLHGVERTDLPPPSETTWCDVDVMPSLIPGHTLVTDCVTGEVVARYPDVEIIGYQGEQRCR